MFAINGGGWVGGISKQQMVQIKFNVIILIQRSRF